jgi:hypothetical protein
MRAGTPVDSADQRLRRSVVPKQIQDAAGQALWPSAIWTGLGAAVVCATLAIVAVAACWLPVSGTTGRTNSAIRAGLLTFLASVHGGVTVDGVRATWLPLGMMVIVGVAAWRAGSGLADVADAAQESDPVRLALTGVAQMLSFTVGCLVAVPFATLGTSSAPFLGVAVGAAGLFAVTGGVAFVRASALRDWVTDHVPSDGALVLRAAASVVTVYLAAGALLAASSLVLHHTAAERLSVSVGGGLGGIPVLLLGVLSAPNVAVAAASYIAGPGFAVGAGTHVALFGTATGILPAFPVLAAVPTGRPNPAAWVLAAAVPLVAGTLVVRLLLRTPGWRRRLGLALAAVATAGLVLLVLGWQGGGAVADGRLHTVGASPWQLGGAVAAAVLAVTLLGLGITAAAQAIARHRADEDDDGNDKDDEDDEDDEDDGESLVAALRRGRWSTLVVPKRHDDVADDGSDQRAAG